MPTNSRGLKVSSNVCSSKVCSATFCVGELSMWHTMVVACVSIVCTPSVTGIGDSTTLKSSISVCTSRSVDFDWWSLKVLINAKNTFRLLGNTFFDRRLNTWLITQKHLHSLYQHCLQQSEWKESSIGSLSFFCHRLQSGHHDLRACCFSTRKCSFLALIVKENIAPVCGFAISQNIGLKWYAWRFHCVKLELKQSTKIAFVPWHVPIATTDGDTRLLACAWTYTVCIPWGPRVHLSVILSVMAFLSAWLNTESYNTM